MYQRDVVLHLVSLIYDAALNPEAWRPFLEAFAEVTHSHTASLTYLDSEHRSRSVIATGRCDPALPSELFGYYGTIIPWTEAARARGLWKSGMVALGEAVVPNAAYLETEFYNDFGRRFGLFGGIGAATGAPRHRAFFASAGCAPGTLGSAEVALVRALLPHIQRALILHRRLTALETQAAAAVEAIDRVPFAVILVDGRGRPMVVNATARRLLARCDGLRSTPEGLATNLASETGALHRLIADAIATTRGTGLTAGGEMTLSRTSPRSSLQVAVSPLRTGNEYGENGQQAAAAVFVHDPDEALSVDSDTLRRFYGLTPAEAQVVRLLANGTTVRGISERLGVTLNTVRTHLKRALEKTDTRTQSQLVRSTLSGLATLAKSNGLPRRTPAPQIRR